MNLRFRTAAFAATAVLAALALAAPARAGLVMTVTESGAPSIPIVDGGPLDFDGIVNGAINVDTRALDLLLVNFSASSLSATSNLLIGTGNDVASVSQTGEFSRNATGGSATLTIEALVTGFNFPTGNLKTMTTAASDTFRNTAAGDSRTFQSFFDAGGGSVPSPLLAFVPPIGSGRFGTSNPGVLISLGTQPTPFDLSNTTVITFGPKGAGSAIQSDQFTGATSVTSLASVPEPSSLVTLGVGIIGVALAYTSNRSRRGRFPVSRG